MGDTTLNPNHLWDCGPGTQLDPVGIHASAGLV